MFGGLKDRVFGPERIFAVRKVGEGEYSFAIVQGINGAGFGAFPYTREIPVRGLVVELCVDGVIHQIDTLEALEPLYRMESFNGLSQRQTVKLIGISGQPVRMRAKEPYDSGTLRSLMGKR